MFSKFSIVVNCNSLPIDAMTHIFYKSGGSIVTYPIVLRESAAFHYLTSGMRPAFGKQRHPFSS